MIKAHCYIAKKYTTQLGYLKAYSGMLDGAWLREGFVPPVFDSETRDAYWPEEQVKLDALTDAIESALTSAEFLSAQAALRSVEEACAAEWAESQATWNANKKDRDKARHEIRDAVARGTMDAEDGSLALQKIRH